MRLVEVAHNYNADLIKALLESDILQKYETIFENNVTVLRYDGKDTYFFEIDYYEGDAEYFVPKTVPEDVANDIVMFLELEDVCKGEKEKCEDVYYFCTKSASELYDIYPPEEVDRMMQECEDEFKECVESIKECDVAETAKSNLYKHNVRFFGCIPGKEKGSPDIDEICTFLVR
ncbi:hypothetical protein DRO97_01835 [Archaeoglobales archaeon]|nr:MAG: hypothetical protein DRO97_01835 [Archaeoglobales archaeon]